MPVMTYDTHACIDIGVSVLHVYTLQYQYHIHACILHRGIQLYKQIYGVYGACLMRM